MAISIMTITQSNIKPYYDLIYKLYGNLNYNISSKNIESINTDDFVEHLNFKIYDNSLIDEFKNIHVLILIKLPYKT